MTIRRSVTILGSTGSIGRQAIDVAVAAPSRFEVVALSAGGAPFTGGRCLRGCAVA